MCMNNMPSLGPSAFLKFELFPSLIAGIDLSSSAFAAGVATVVVLGIVLGTAILLKMPEKATRFH